MRVLIITPAVYSLPVAAYGGVEALSFQYAQKLAKVSPNVEVSLAAPRWSHCPGIKEVLQTVDLQSHPEHAWREDLAYKMYHKRLGEFDVIHDFSHRKIASRLRVLPALHMLWHAYGNYPEPKYNLIGLSKWHAQQMKDQYKQEVKPVHMGVDVDVYKPSGKPVSDYFLFIGQPSPTKGCAQAIEYCVKTHQKLHIICGQVPNELQPNKERLQQMCVPAGEIVQTTYLAKPIETVVKGDFVLSYDHNYHEVTDTFQRQYDGKLIEINLSNYHIPLKLTPEHPVLTSRGWVNADKIRVDDNLLFVTQPVNENRITFLRISSYLPDLVEDAEGYLHTYYKTTIGHVSIPSWNETPIYNCIHVTDQFLRLLGYYIADGSPRSGYRICFAKDQTDYIEDVIQISRNLFKLSGTVRKSHENAIEVGVNSTMLGRFFKNLVGSSSLEKHIPDELMRLPVCHLGPLICGLWRGDGHMGNNRAEYDTISKKLALQIFEILVKVGINAFLSQYAPTKNRYGKNKRYVIVVPKRSLRLLQDFMNPTCSTPYLYSTGWPNPLPEFNHRWFAVKSVNESHYVGQVFNLETTHHAYTVNNLAVHNCDGKQITWLGEVSNEVKINELCSARALLHPEQQDAGSSLVAMEAIACGTPAIVPNRCAYPEIIDNESGVCCKSEPEYLAILANNGMLESFDRKKIRARAVKTFSLETMVNSYMNLYDSVRKGENW